MEKIYYVSNMAEAYRKITSELGPDALIINTEDVSEKDDNMLQYFGNKTLKVTAVTHNNSLYEKQENSNENNKVINPFDKSSKTGDNSDIDLRSLESQINDLKNLVTALSNNNPVCEINKVEKKDELFKSELKNNFLKRLKQNEVCSDVAFKMLSPLNPNNTKDVRGFIRNIIEERFTLDDLSGNEKIYFFMGHPGCGKTTSIVKLGVTLSLALKKKVLNITTDIYKESGFEQLYEQSHFLGVNTLKANNSEELFEIISEEYDNYDYIFIDTPGVDKDFRSLLDLFPEKLNFKKVLVLNANGRYREQQKKIESFQKIGFDDYLFTKMDETSSYGNIMNILYNNTKNIMAIMNGQDTAKDIIINEQRCVDYLMEGIC